MKVSWKNCFRICISVFLLYLCIDNWRYIRSLFSMLSGAVVPILVGIAIAYIVNILMVFYEKLYFRKKERKKLVRVTRRPVCMFAAFLTLCGIITLVIWVVVPEIISCIKYFGKEIPHVIDRFLKISWVEDIMPQDIRSTLSSIDWMNNMTKIMETLSSGVGGAVSLLFNAVSSILSTVVSLFIGIIIAIYLLLGKEHLQGQCRSVIHAYLPSRLENRFYHCLRVLNDSFHKYIVGQCAEAVILGVLCTVGMYIFRFPFAPMVGAVISFTALIPIVGALIGACVGVILMLTISPMKALLFILFIIVLQQLEGNIIYPKVVGKSMGLPGLWVLVAVTIGGGLFGIPGILVGVPITSALYQLIREDIVRRRKKKLAVSPHPPTPNGEKS